MLAQLYEAEGRWPDAVRQLRTLLEEEKKSPYYHAFTIRALLRHKEVDEARIVLERFAKLNVTPVELVELRTRVLDAEGKKAEAIKLVQNYAQQKDAVQTSAALLLATTT